ncbi:MAG: hypothetical protein ACOYOU_00695 [Kiritimatiellia bacterium]
MPFRLFHDLFPEIAEQETRSIFLPKSQGGLPAGGYAFKEMFCDEPGCDCRRVFFWVDTSFRDGVEAVIAWGWEDLAFYQAWMKHGDEDDVKHLQGPELNIGSPESELAPHLLELFRQVLLKDADYIERVKRHYRMFRDAVDSGGSESNDGESAAFPAKGHAGESTKTSRASNPMTGACTLCHASIPKAQATRHVTACLKARLLDADRQVTALHLRVQGRYHPEYWMHLEIASAWTLHDLDDFLRRTWLECCDHLSRFTIGGTFYARTPFNESLSGRHEKSMDAKLYKAIPPGTEFTHEYDYGSTTHLVLRSIGAHKATLGDVGIRVLARNAPIEVLCVKCRTAATIVEAGWNGLNRDRCFCQDCADSEIGDEGMRLPIVNSPRVGVCGYCG